MIVFLFIKQHILRLGAPPEFYILGASGDFHQRVDIDSFNKVGLEVVTFDVEKLIDSMRKEDIQLKATLIDISQLYKLISGRPSKELKTAHPFSFDKILLYYKIFPRERIEIISKGINVETKSISDEDISDIILGLRKVYYHIIIDAKRLNEFDRFFKIELGVCQILYERELRGIRVSTEKIKERLNILDEVEYQCQNMLRYNYKIIDPGDNENIVHALTSNGFKFFPNNLDHLDNQNIDQLLKVGATTNKLLELLYNYRRARKDKHFLYRFTIIGNERIFPVYDCIGTVTSRILVKEPLIQQLRKSSRDVFIPDDDFEFIYADFGQFEPAILADKAVDETLLGLYNSGDVYDGLSSTVFGTKALRSIAKILFLSYMYGMTIDSLSKIVNDVIPEQNEGITEKLERFFTKFNSLTLYKAQLEQELSTNNRIGTSYGNYRRRTSTRTGLLPQEKRWILSQRIQGTASLILKKAILDLAANKKIEFLIPMHDAALFQVPSKNVDETKATIYEAFCNAFQSECPSIVPKVHFSNFDE